MRTTEGFLACTVILSVLVTASQAYATKVDIHGLTYGMPIEMARRILEEKCKMQPDEITTLKPIPLHKLYCRVAPDDITADFDFVKGTIDYVELAFNSSLSEQQLIDYISKTFAKIANSQPDLDSIASWDLTEDGDDLNLIHDDMSKIIRGVHDPHRYSIVLSRKVKTPAPPPRVPPL